ncbi:MAG: 2OG-Fe(II) oxygenase [Planctomycetales bacterium]|nr:2OG-Fe(II) oxygenase [Planctomycetales bacterium]
MPEYQFVTDEIFTVSEFLDRDECLAHIEFAESMGFADAPITTASGPQMRKDIRNNARVMFDSQDRAGELWSRLEMYVPHMLGPWRACGVNERLRYYRYEAGQQFDWHFDGYFERENGQRSQLTFLVYLNDGFAGGHTAFDRVSVEPREGLALCFVHAILHKGEPVLDGVKYVLRTDVMYQRQ